MKAQGIPLHQCEVCQKLVNDNHECIATRWITEGQRGVHKGLVVTRTGTGAIKLQERQLVDQNVLNKEYEEILKLKKQLEERTRRAEEALSPSTPEHNTIMQSSSSSSQTLSSSTPPITVTPPPSV